ncbi:MAG: autotransporter-associated beta strand repeat-containing protein [Verrucomicrobiota bacterium JB025]|nr:autotransporter-associated beta strand repeat-containing protein [Verrucomicrobiota bacterium JB025]
MNHCRPLPLATRILVPGVLAVISATAWAQIIWDNSDADNNFTNPSNWQGDSFPAGETLVIGLADNDRAILSTGAPPNSDAIRVGYDGDTGEFVQSGGTLSASANASATSRIGHGGGIGSWTMSAGRATINAIQIGLTGGNGTLSVTGGHLNISRASSDYSLIVDHGGTGLFEISGGSLITRSGVEVGPSGTFSVIGNAPEFIHVGSTNNIDGEWHQSSGGTLKARISPTPAGITPIFIDEVDTTDGSAGNVTFENGALLDVGFTGNFTNGGTFTVMEWEGSVTDNGLALAPGVDTGIWSFDIDETNKRLTVTAAGPPYLETNVTVSSIAELRQFAAEDNVTVTMTPGTYWMTGPSTAYTPNSGTIWTFLEFTGENSTYNLDGVTINVDTRELSYFNNYAINVMNVSGNGSIIDGLKLHMRNLTLRETDQWGYPRQWTGNKGSQVVRVTGSDTTIRNCEITTGGSYPYGFGDAFGKGARPTDGEGNTNAAFISHVKQSGFLITGGANNVLVDNVTLNMRSYGHGFFMQQGASDITFSNCQCLGDDMADSDDIIAHPVYQQWGFATYKEPIPTDINISKHEGGFRVYGNSDFETNGFPEFIENITISNCRVERMRTGVSCADATGFLRVSDTEVVGCEFGYAPSGYGTETTYTRCKGDALNGPLIYFQRSVDHPATMEIELTGDSPGKGTWPIALISGDGSHITLTSSAAPGVYPDDAYINLSQKWREWRHRPAEDIDEYSSGAYAENTTNTTLVNHSSIPVIIGPNATGNTIESAGGIVNKSSGNTYTGTTIVLPHTTVQDTWSSPANPMDVSWAQWDSEGNQILPTAPYLVYDGLLYVDHLEDVGGSWVESSEIEIRDGGTLEINPGFRLQGDSENPSGNITFAGSGTDGQGAIFSSGATSNSTRINSANGTLSMTGDASIGVGTAANQLLIGPVTGTGNLTKTGPGKLVMERFTANSFTGSLTVAEGEITARTGKANNDLTVAAGASFLQNSNLALNQSPDEFTTIDGTLDLNTRSESDANPYSVNIGTLAGTGAITATSSAATHTVHVTGDSADGTFSGEIQGTLSLVKSGAATLTLSGTNSHSGATIVNGGTLSVTGSLPSSSEVTVNDGAALSGTGTIHGPIALETGAVISPGTSTGTLTTASQIWNAGAELEIEMADPPELVHDQLVITGPLTLDAGITPQDPFLIRLTAPTLTFDKSQNQSWLIVSTGGISGGFSPDRFAIDPTSFIANNPVDRGEFSLSESNGDLYIDFTAAPYSLLESWRLAHFGSPDDSGDGADHADFDSDGIPNLLEYAIGSDPALPNTGPVIELAASPDATTLTLTFNRIADPQLRYAVEAENTLVQSPWTPIWSSTGPSNTAGPVTVEDIQPISAHPTRFMRLSVSY